MSIKPVEERMEELQRRGLDKSISLAIAADEHARAFLKTQEEKKAAAKPVVTEEPVVETPVESARPVVAPVVEASEDKKDTLADKKEKLIKKLEEKVEEVKDEINIEVTKK